MRLIDIILTAGANTRRSKLRTVLTVGAIFIGAFTLTLTNGLGSGISSYIDKQVDNLGAKDVLIIQPKGQGAFGGGDSSEPKEYDPSKKVSATEFGTSAVVLTDADVTKIKKVEGIKSVEPNLIVSANYFEGPNGKKYQGSINPYISGSNIDLASGTQLNNEAAENQALLPVEYVSIMGYSSEKEAVGKKITVGVTDGFGQLHQISGTIKGVQQKGLTNSGGMSTNTAFTNALYKAQTTGLPPSATNGYQVLVAKFDASYSQQQITDLKNKLKDQGYEAQTLEDSIGTFKSVISGIIAVLDAFAVIALLAASFGIINTLLMSVQERTKEIGLMKAMGMSGPRIFLLFSTEAVVLGFWGSFLGVIAAEVVGRIIDNFASKGFLKDLVGLKLLDFPLSSVAIIIAIVMVIAFLAGTLPAYRAARQNPIDSLRYE